MRVVSRRATAESLGGCRGSAVQEWPETHRRLQPTQWNSLREPQCFMGRRRAARISLPLSLFQTKREVSHLRESATLVLQLDPLHFQTASGLARGPSLFLSPLLQARDRETRLRPHPSPKPLHDAALRGNSVCSHCPHHLSLPTEPEFPGLDIPCRDTDHDLFLLASFGKPGFLQRLTNLRRRSRRPKRSPSITTTSA